MDIDAKIERVSDFRDQLIDYRVTRSSASRTFLNENMRSVRREVIEAGCMQTLTIGPPPAVGGPVMQNADPFGLLFNAPWGLDVSSTLIDMLEQTIGALRELKLTGGEPRAARITTDAIQKGYIFIAMPMGEGLLDLDDVHDAIKHAAQNCGFTAERTDDVQSNERITDRLLESIRRAEYVIVDLTGSRPNVFYEAGYAHGLGKTPIYVARGGTKLEFDLRDYPVILFDNMRELRTGLEARLRALAAP